jgi:uncharacterized protein YkwD
MPRWLVKLLHSLFGPRPPVPGPVPPAPPSEPDLSAEALAALAAHNRERAAHGLSRLTIDSVLRSRAQGHSGRMAAEGRLFHSPGGAENVAWNYPTGAGVVAGWMKSDGHRANILNPYYTHVGIGVARSPIGETYWTAIYG